MAEIALVVEMHANGCVRDYARHDVIKRRLIK